MALYQNSVLKKYLKQQDSDVVAKAYKKFAKYFHDPKIQENIRSSKEEEYQGIFLTELFSKILGYTMKPNANFNLVAEYKNEKNSRKADGAILKDNEALGVIELKGTNTKDLEKVRQQAFDYKANQTGCVYVITSNFEKVRFYINNAVDFEEFDLFTINQERFELLYLCLAQENLLNSIPLKIKEASVQEEEAITKKFYKDYSTFKRELFRDLVKLNMKNEVFRTELNNEDADRATKNIKHHLFKKSQKLIDRFLFIFFAEDRGLLPPNSTVKILEQWDKLKELDEVVPLYSRYKKYFNYLDTGRKGTDKTAEIYAYNGGLFKPDPVLDSLLISDELLYKHTNALQAYDFESQVDVNILGHIFENSLNEIESVNAEIEGTDFDKQTTKRKKDGVFYTPKYITKYIVDNTVGKLCNQKKTELKIIEEEFHPKRQKETKKNLLAALEAYREWLLQLTILDPACGSGAFLNQALDFLIKEHHYIDELQTNLLGGGLVFPNIETTVLENNIFGVDLNEESVEIAKLSLWLRTAQPRRKLNNLSSNIKCGNSLIDSKTIAGDKAFKWKDEFVEIFAKGGFDVVIGNPPYVRKQGLMEHYPEMCDYYEKTFTSSTGNYDIYALFMEHSYSLINDDGIVSYILPHKFLVSEFGEGIRSFFIKNKCIHQINHFQEHLVFDDASTYTCIIDFNKKINESFLIREIEPLNLFDEYPFYNIKINSLTTDKWTLKNPEIEGVLNKLSTNIDCLGDWIKIFSGIQTSGDNIYIIHGEQKGDQVIGYSNSLGEIVHIEKDMVKPLVKGDGVKRYEKLVKQSYVVFPYHIESNKALPMKEEDISLNYPNCYDYLKKHEEILRGREKGKMDKDGWFLYVYPKNLVSSNSLKMVSPDITYGLQVTRDDTGICVKNGAYGITLKEGVLVNEYIVLAILNSNLLWFFLKQTGNVLRGGYFRFNTKYINPFPVPKIDNLDWQIIMIEKIHSALATTESFSKTITKFTNYLQSQFKIEKLPKKLQNWHELEFGDFIKELNKAIKKVGGEKLTKMDEMDWMEVFETKKAEALTLKAQIDKTDAQIDAMVYELYGLSEEEIKIVENN